MKTAMLVRSVGLALAISGLGCAGGNEGTGGRDVPGSPADRGHPGSDWVNAGQRMNGGGHNMSVSMGQSSQNQGIMKSKKYRLQGGVIGVTEKTQ